MSAFLNAVIFVFLLSFVVVVHELGHFVVAKLCGIKVLEFAVGMGPVLFSTTRGETQYSVRAIPIGGFVSMLGENPEPDEDEDADVEKAQNSEMEIDTADVSNIKCAADEGRKFSDKPPLQRLAVLLAGIFNNLVIGILLMMAYFTINGVVSNISVIDTPMAGYPAHQAGLLKGDRITHVNGKAVDSWVEVVEAIAGSDGGDISFVVYRGGETISRSIAPVKSDEGRLIIGITPIRQKDLYTVFRVSIQSLGEMVSGTIKGFAGLFASRQEHEIVGPIGLFRVVGEVREYGERSEVGYTPFLLLASNISISIGLVNLLPIPVLDGGRAVIVLGEMITRRKLSKRVEGALMLAGVAFIFMLMAYAFYSDIANIFTGAR